MRIQKRIYLVRESVGHGKDQYIFYVKDFVIFFLYRYMYIYTKQLVYNLLCLFVHPYFCASHLWKLSYLYDPTWTSFWLYKLQLDSRFCNSSEWSCLTKAKILILFSKIRMFSIFFVSARKLRYNKFCSVFTSGKVQALLSFTKIL